MEYKYLHGRGKLGEGLAVKAKPAGSRDLVPFKTLRDVPPRVIALVPEFDPRVHQDVKREDALQLSAREAVVVYSRPDEEGTQGTPGAAAIGRRIVYGPALFVPQPGEWLHTFSWHGSKGGSRGVERSAEGSFALALGESA